ncbi:hypothetical protein SKAU_G00353930, partial [Synaphobranchus kaupii]
ETLFVRYLSESANRKAQSVCTRLLRHVALEIATRGGILHDYITETTASRIHQQLRKCPGLTAEQRESALVSILVSDGHWWLGTCGPRMTASDSDCSIDWLASDDEDSSCGESDCGRQAGAGQATPRPEPEPSGESPGAHAQHRTTASPPHGHAGDVREGGDDDSNCAESWDRLSGKQEPQTMLACRSGQKRPCCQGAPEHRGKQQEAEADKLLHHKCQELQCYILPLTSILNGLQSGRYRERLSSFQESVAMDRIRRILGVLQNPCMGERYINIILKVEVMLKTWFPNVKPIDQQAGDHDQEAAPSKRQKISPVNMVPPISASIPASLCGQPSNKAQQVSEVVALGVYSATNLMWLHTSPICSPAEEPSLRGPRNWATPRVRGVTQDNAVSSSTDPDPEGDPAPNTKARPLPPQSQPPSGKISAPCLERLLKSTESIVTRRGVGGAVDSGWS